MKAINITKFSNHTEHFYATFWNISPYVDLENIRNGYLTLDCDVFTNMEETHGNRFSHIKNSNEKKLIMEAKKKLKDSCGIAATIIIVFNDGKYSEYRSKLINRRYVKKNILK